MPETKAPTSSILVRLPVTIHEALKAAAKVEGKSLNALCVEKLAGSAVDPVVHEPPK